MAITSTHPFLAACRREQTPYTPVWLMRQAGRYMEEYRKLRAQHAFLDLCKSSDLAAEITVTPVERLGVDAAILFADILLLLEPMGVGLEYTKGDGPVIQNTVSSRTHVEQLIEFDPAEALPFVFETVRKVCTALNGKVPLIGFAGAPFTLASYLIEGGSSRNYLKTKRLIYSNPGAWRGLMERLSSLTAKYLRAAGGNVIGVDWRVNLDTAWDDLGHDVGIQGNLDPAALLSSPKDIRRRVAEILRRAGGKAGHIFNLGHGVLPETPVENVIAMVEAVHELSSR